MLTFGRGGGAVRRAGAFVRGGVRAVRAERHQPPHDSSLAGAGVTDDDGAAPLAAAAFPEDLFQTREEPVPADERRLGRDARHFEQQRFEHNVSLLEWHQSPWEDGREGRGGGWGAV